MSSDERPPSSGTRNRSLRRPSKPLSTVISGLDLDVEKSKSKKRRFSLSETNKFYLTFVGIPMLISLWYACAILFPEGSYRPPFIVWTDGALTRDENGAPVLCPRETICSEGVFQVICISISRLTAFAAYVVMAHTFITKMHCSIHFLSGTYLQRYIRFAKLHEVHKNAGRWFAILAVIHTIFHFIRWIIRGDMALTGTRVGISGVFGVVTICFVVLSMSSFAKRYKWLSFEKRFNVHWMFLFLGFCILFHTKRCGVITLIFVGLWALDYIYGTLYKTHRLDLVEFIPLPGNTGTQVLWRNPDGFTPTSGEYCKVQFPWLSEKGDEWHPFSIYLKELTTEGLEEVFYQKYGIAKIRTYGFEDAKGGGTLNPKTTALVLVEFQNEYAHHAGKLYGGVRDVIESNDMLRKTSELIKNARSLGVKIFHVPMHLSRDGIDNPNKNLGVFKQYFQGDYFTKGTWNAEIIESHAPEEEDTIIEGKLGLDCFLGSNLQFQLENQKIESIILAGFLTNGCVESTMRTAFEKGFNVITLSDGTACGSVETQEHVFENSFQMCSLPMSCAEVEDVLKGTIPERLKGDIKSDSENFSNGTEVQKPLEESIIVGDESVYNFVEQLMLFDGVDEDEKLDLLILKEARETRKYETTQMFIAPVGDWTKVVYEDISNHRLQSSSWVRGPFVSPYSVASDFRFLILVASGIGITPALGVMGQYHGNSRFKVLMWSTRSKTMLKYFVPLMEDAHIAIIYYTGKETLTRDELKRLKSSRNIYIKTSRPESLPGEIADVITATSSATRLSKCARDINRVPKTLLDKWCVFYCGGSKFICGQLKKSCKEFDVTFEYELFDW